MKQTTKQTAANNAFLARVRAAFAPMFGAKDRKYYGAVLQAVNDGGDLAGAHYIYDELRGMGKFSFAEAEERIAECLGLPSCGKCPDPECQGMMRASEYREFRLSCCYCEYYEVSDLRSTLAEVAK